MTNTEMVIESRDSNRDDLVKAFISFCQEDEHIAKEIVRCLEAHADRLDCWTYREQPAGTRFRRDIKEALEEADWLIVPYSRSLSQWCISEITTFLNLMDHEKPQAREDGSAQSSRRLIVFHPAHLPPPDFINNRYVVPARIDDVIEELKHIFGDPLPRGGRPLNRRLAEEADYAVLLEALAEKICSLVNGDGRPPEIDECVDQLIIHLKRDAKEHLVQAIREMGSAAPGNPNDWLAQAEIEADKPILWFFGLDTPSPGAPWTWGQLYGQFDDRERDWAMSVATELALCAARRRFSVVFPKLVSAAAGQHWRAGRIAPVSAGFYTFLLRTKRRPNGDIDFVIGFVEQQPEHDPGPPGDLGDLIAVLRVARWFRWGVIEEYQRQLRMAQNNNAGPDEVHELMGRLVGALARSEGSLPPRFRIAENLRALLDSEESRNEFDSVIAEWRGERPKLNQAIEESDAAAGLEKALATLGALRSINKRFLVLFADEYHKSLAAMA